MEGEQPATNSEYFCLLRRSLEKPGYPKVTTLEDVVRTTSKIGGGLGLERRSETLGGEDPLEFAQIHVHLTLCHRLLLLPSVFPSIRVFSNESALRIRWLKY